MNPIKAISAWLESAATPEERAYRDAAHAYDQAERAARGKDTPELEAARTRLAAAYGTLALSRGENPATGPIGAILRGDTAA